MDNDDTAAATPKKQNDSLTPTDEILDGVNDIHKILCRRFKEMDKTKDLSLVQLDQLIKLSGLIIDNALVHKTLTDIAEDEQELQDRVKKHPEWGQ